MNTNTGSKNMNVTAFVLSLIGGILMLINGGMSFMMLTFYGADFGFMWGTIGALMLNYRPAERRSWGIVILIFSVISFLGMGGFFIGAILGVIGGALALCMFFQPCRKQSNCLLSRSAET